MNICATRASSFAASPKREGNKKTFCEGMRCDLASCSFFLALCYSAPPSAYEIDKSAWRRCLEFVVLYEHISLCNQSHCRIDVFETFYLTPFGIFSANVVFGSRPLSAAYDQRI